MNHVMSHPAAIVRSYPTNASVNEGYRSGETHEMDLMATYKGSKQPGKTWCGTVNLPQGFFIQETQCTLCHYKSPSCSSLWWVL